MNLSCFPNGLRSDVYKGPELPGGTLKKQTQIEDFGDLPTQTYHNDLFEDDIVIWSMTFGLVVPIVTYDDSSLLMYTPELYKMTFLRS